MHAPLAANFTTEWRSFAALTPLAGEWRDLAARAVEPNIFYEPDFALPAAPVFGRDAGAIVVRSMTGRLVGLFPMRQPRFGSICGYVHPYAPLGTPLVDRDDPDAVIGAWLNYLATQSRVVMLPLLPDKGRIADAISRTCAARGLETAPFASHRRAILRPGIERSNYDDGSKSKSRKETDRRRRRLAEMGALSHRTVRDADGMRGVVADFLKIEASGWKGRAGTAARGNAALSRFLQEAILSLARDGKAYGEMLALDGKTIAVTIMFRSGRNAWAWKIAYDEDYARFSPGIQVALDATRTLLADSDIVSTDSCTPPDLPMIDHLWHERLAISDRLIGLHPGRAMTFGLYRVAESIRRAARAVAKSALRQLRPR